MNHILVIDSNTDYYLLLKRKLKFIRSTISFAASAKEVTSNLARINFKLIIVSHLMRNSCGTEMVDLLKELGYDGPIMVITNDPKSKRLYTDVDAILDKCSCEEDFKKEIKKIFCKVRSKGLAEDVSARN